MARDPNVVLKKGVPLDHETYNFLGDIWVPFEEMFLIYFPR